MAKKPARMKHGLPTRQAILDFIRETPGKVGKREITRAFNIKGDDRLLLKALLKEMKEDGQLGGQRDAYGVAGELPQVTVLDVYARDKSGEFLCRPKDWGKDDGPMPTIYLVRSKRGRATSEAAGMNDRILARITPIKGEKNTYEASPIRVLENKREKRLAVFEDEPRGGGRLTSIEKKGGEVFYVDSASTGGAKNRDLVAFEVGRERSARIARARVIEVLGNVSEEKAISLIALYAHDIPVEFSKATLDEAAKAKPASLKGREDMRALPLVTIDPHDAKDHDDAVFAEKLENGGFMVYVAIADVAAYVRPQSAMDREAEERGNSVYFPDRVVPMLPEQISNNLCSLIEGEDRPSMVIRMEFDAKGHKKSQTLHRALIRSHAKLSYNMAQALIDGTASVEDAAKHAQTLTTSLKPLWAAYEVLCKGRELRQPLELVVPERKILLNEAGRVASVIVPERLDAHKLIEEFMIQANVAAAQLLEAKKTSLIYRVHDAPSLAKLESLREFLKSLDIALGKTETPKPSDFNLILASVAGLTHEQLTNEVVLRSQSQAVYQPDNIGHFGLNLQRYAHFTSPIRRYADLIVHRALIRAYGLGDDGMTEQEEGRLDEIAAHISATERRAMMAERETTDRLIADFLAEQLGASFEGRISGVVGAGLFVRLNDTGADGFVPAATLGQDYYVFDEANRAMVGSRTGETYRLGDAVSVKLVEVAPISGGLRFEVTSEGSKGVPPKGGRSPRGPRGAPRCGFKPSGRNQSTRPASKGRRHS
jgi:ribonuclease R